MAGAVALDVDGVAGVPAGEGTGVVAGCVPVDGVPLAWVGGGSVGKSFGVSSGVGGGTPWPSKESFTCESMRWASV